MLTVVNNIKALCLPSCVSKSLNVCFCKIGSLLKSNIIVWPRVVFRQFN